MKTKRIIALTLAAAMLLGTAGTSTFAGEEVFVDEICDDNDIIEFEEPIEDQFSESTSDFYDEEPSFMTAADLDMSADLIEDDQNDIFPDFEDDFEDEFENDFEDGFAEDMEEDLSEGLEAGSDVLFEDGFTDDFTDDFAGETADEITDDFTGETTVEITDDFAGETADEITDDFTGETAVEMTDDFANEPAVEIADDPAGEPADEIVDEFVEGPGEASAALTALFEDEFVEGEEIAEEDMGSDDAVLAAAEEETWKTLYTKANVVRRQVMIFEREDGTWTDDLGLTYTRNEDGTWTDANGVVYSELTGTDDDLFDDDDLIDDEDQDQKDDGSRDTAFDEFITETKKMSQGVINGFIDSITRTCPDLLPIAGALKVLVGEMFGMGSGPDSSQVMLQKLNEIEAQLKNMEKSLKEHMENVVTFDSIGGEFQAVADAIPPLECKIGDAMGKYRRGKIDEDELNRRLAAMYDMGEYNSLMQALSGATNSYQANTSFSLDRRSIFTAAYLLQCEKVMFSGEAVDCVTPYLIRQLCTYLKGYTLINTVLDAYEAVNGDDSTLYTRQVMFQNTGGIAKGQFDEKAPGVFGLYRDFFNTYRYTFVNMSSNPAAHVRLGKDIYAVFGFSENYLGSNGPTTAPGQEVRYTPEFMSKFPLNAGQMNSLAAYAAAKNTTLFDLLFNTVGFELKIAPTLTLIRYFGLNYGACTPESTICFPGFGDIIPGKSMTLREILRDGTTYIPTGAQYITAMEEWMSNHAESPSYNYMQGIRVNKVGAGDERLMLAYSLDPKWQTRAINPNMLYFTR